MESRAIWGVFGASHTSPGALGFVEVDEGRLAPAFVKASSTTSKIFNFENFRSDFESVDRSYEVVPVDFLKFFLN